MRFIKKITVYILCAVFLMSIPATEIYASDLTQVEKMTGWRTINGKKYYFDKNGNKVTGLKKIGEDKYYFNKNGVMQTGLKKIKNKKYYFDEDFGYMAVTSLYKNYLIDYKGICHKIPTKKTGNKKQDAKRVAKLIVKCIPKKGKEKDVDRIGRAAFYVFLFCERATYTMKGKDYREAYGVFISKKFSCAGSTRALGMVLDCMGYKWKHVNKNKNAHQWCQVKMDGKKGYADGMIGMAGYGKHMMAQ